MAQLINHRFSICVQILPKWHQVHLQFSCMKSSCEKFCQASVFVLSFSFQRYKLVLQIICEIVNFISFIHITYYIIIVLEFPLWLNVFLMMQHGLFYEVLLLKFILQIIRFLQHDKLPKQEVLHILCPYNSVRILIWPLTMAQQGPNKIKAFICTFLKVT